MNKKDRLIKEANKRWKEGDSVVPLTSPKIFKWKTGDTDKNCKGYQFSDNFYYDEEADTLSNWGRGLGLLYSKGKWAEDKQIIQPIIY